MGSFGGQFGRYTGDLFWEKILAFGEQFQRTFERFWGEDTLRTDDGVVGGMTLENIGNLGKIFWNAFQPWDILGGNFGISGQLKKARWQRKVLRDI